MRLLSSLLLLSAAVEATFRMATSKYDSENAIRIKGHAVGSDVCYSDRASYSGWADIGSRHIFYCKALEIVIEIIYVFVERHAKFYCRASSVKED